MENSPVIRTERLVLRRFVPEDADAFMAIINDREVNTFLPLFPFGSREEAANYLRERYLDTYARPRGFRYAICLKGNYSPIGYMQVGEGDSYDFGYGLARAYWGRGMVTEAARAVVERLPGAGYPYITATHDVNNPASGRVMQKIGMSYRYSYEEQWQPKDITVVFRLYQLDFVAGADTYGGYRERYPVHFVEKNI